MMKQCLSLVLFGLALTPSLRAELKLPAIIGDHMVLQQKLADPIWGWDTPGTKITVTFARKHYATTVGADCKWTVKLAPMAAGPKPQTLTVAGTTTQQIKDVLIGEVWMCSGQSNMGFPLDAAWNGDLEAEASSLPELRLITVPHVGTQVMQDDFKGNWKLSTPDTARRFTAVGLIYGRYLQQILHVPVGLIENEWPGSMAEAWVRRSSLEKDPHFRAIVEWADKNETELESPKGRADFAQALAASKARSEKAKAEGKTPPPPPEDWLTSRVRPGNIFAGVVHPTIGYGIRGVIWYQGESNVSRVDQYAYLFQFLIQQWRKEWGQGDFPFYWVQLPNYDAVKPMGCAGDWALMREAQSEALKLPNTGQAITIDLGEGNNLHPKDKFDVALRLLRWPLARDYGLKLPYRSPEFKSLAITGNKALVTFDCFGSSLRSFGAMEASGFALCGADQVWHPAVGTLVGTNAVEVSSPDVVVPIAVRYAWANNPICNLYSNDGLPVTPFRTDD
jgi:sialate O-acetylesterase